MLARIRRFLLRLAVTPGRVRALIARIVSVFLQWATETRAWDTVSRLPGWLRRIADFIECFNSSELSGDRDRLIAELVRYAVTDEAVDRLIDTVVGLGAAAHPDEVRLLSRPELIRLLKDAK